MLFLLFIFNGRKFSNHLGEQAFSDSCDSKSAAIHPQFYDVDNSSVFGYTLFK